jgi:hypothetical protein
VVHAYRGYEDDGADAIDALLRDIHTACSSAHLPATRPIVPPHIQLPEPPGACVPRYYASICREGKRLRKV